MEAQENKKIRAFLAAYAEVGNITRAAKLAGINRNSHYAWLQNDPEYPDMFKEADRQAGDRLEEEARRRAVEGTEKPVFQGGKLVGTIREYSDTLLIFLMKGAMPEKYKERFSSEHTGKNGGPIEVRRYDQLSETELDAAISEKLASLGKGGLTDPA